MMKLSTMFKNPVLKAAFERVERDGGGASVDLDRKPRGPVLVGGASKVFETA